MKYYKNKRFDFNGQQQHSIKIIRSLENQWSRYDSYLFRRPHDINAKLSYFVRIYTYKNVNRIKYTNQMKHLKSK